MFCGQIDQAAVQRIFQGVGAAMMNKVTHLHAIFQTSGGFVGDGVCLFNFFKTCPLDITLYNIGSVVSIGTIAYLGAKKRKTSARASFMIHRSTNSPQFATASRLQAVTQGLLIDDARTESILREHVTLSNEQWIELNYNDLSFSGEEAVRIGLAHEIGEFSPPPGTQVFNI